MINLTYLHKGNMCIGHYELGIPIILIIKNTSFEAMYFYFDLHEATSGFLILFRRSDIL